MKKFLRIFKNFKEQSIFFRFFGKFSVFSGTEPTENNNENERHRAQIRAESGTEPQSQLTNCRIVSKKFRYDKKR